MKTSIGRIAVALASAAVRSVAFAQPDGKYLTILGDCAGCHTHTSANPYAGGRALTSPLGTFYTSNITPDRETGIGTWTADDFWQAFHDGRSRSRGHLYPAMPYPHFTMYSRADSDAMFAYLQSVPPVSNVPPRNELSHCQDRHNYDGTGVPRRFPTLTGSPTVQARDATTIVRIILEGQEPPAIRARPDDEPMPAFAEKMTDGEIADVATYMRNAWDNRAPAVSMQQVQDLRTKLAAENP